MEGGASRTARPREAGLEGQRLGKLLLAPAAGISRAKQARERDGELGSLRNVSLGACSTSVSLILANLPESSCWLLTPLGKRGDRGDAAGSAFAVGSLLWQAAAPTSGAALPVPH